ncbi:IS21 family transposase [Caldicellulosiruptor changbaiensis]|uniref:IS21 family transposase n=1 Tax=Caldicellulosiruptor changbaiensis TaxID=1222016 RepID=A0A3T0D906_9FIRM|nr:IS21 family transposase [Caldicellulosiruptor changbaiensis]AZT91627.1 IS21 family transposase [Caldicellulosiruptor changbaiensis]AZT91647.1 IS21 family transposase [Caldicellulosiruptor changbaiensis]AZT91660.1 IS21 family transposase [Caldicellulosiruptor changbaiensis]AZT91714.1 IS21 family transposase [Caldicellulosiruptor changbaiensis]AZT91721.1 IS21 family transposase [Caldicellulosiruptor changbaiensis]
MHTTIYTLFKRGYNKSQIARLLDVDRKTVRKVIHDIEQKGEVERKSKGSVLDNYREFIEAKVNKGHSAKKIHQDLQAEFDFEGSYSNVRRYVQKLKQKIANSKVYMVLTTLPAEEAQVDFGYIGKIKVDGKFKKAWVFTMVLSYSRYMYAEIVFDQTVETFIQCHKNAFKYFGGVVEVVKIDNLKAGVLSVDFYEAQIQKDYASFASHYGFLPQPCRVYTPTDKGKVESAIKYVKQNCFSGEEFKDIDEAREHLKNWLDNVANVRVHGTTKKVPKEVFISEEKEKLIALPIEEYYISRSSIHKVATNCHLIYKGNYYSVPYEYAGREVEVVEIGSFLRVFFEGKEIALHQIVKNNEKGKYVTNKEHYPSSKNITIEDIMSRQRDKMAEIGNWALEFFEEFIKREGFKKYDYRSISGIIALKERYGAETVDNACKRALKFGGLSYKVVKNICEKGISDLPEYEDESYVNEERTELYRDIREYNKLLEIGELQI